MFNGKSRIVLMFGTRHALVMVNTGVSDAIAT